MKIAVLYTCFNRKEKTLASLESCYKALRKNLGEVVPEGIEVEVFLTDDGCTDGTPEAIRKQFADKTIHILKGTGNMFWAGGMRFAWNEAMNMQKEWDFYLLLNDDTYLLESAFIELINTHLYCINKYGKSGIYSGITCDPINSEMITYGGVIFVNKLRGVYKKLGKSSIPQMCDMTNANIMLVHKNVVSKIGILNKDYIHGAADFDYTYTARKNDIPVLITANHCGICDFDHMNDNDHKNKLCSMTLKDRKKYFSNPITSGKDYELLIKRTVPLKYPITWIFRKLNLYCPSFYFWLHNNR